MSAKKKKAEVTKDDASFVERLMEMPEADRRLAVIFAALKQPKEERDRVITVIGEAIRSRALAI